MVGNRYLPLAAILVALRHCAGSATTNSQGANFRISLSGVKSENLKADGFTYCFRKELTSGFRFIGALSVDAGKEVSRLQIYLSQNSIADKTPRPCRYLPDSPGQLLYIWHHGTSQHLSLANTGSGDAGFPITGAKAGILLVVTFSPSTALLGTIQNITANLLLSNLDRRMISGMVSVHADVSADETEGRDHVISACQYQKPAILMPTSVFWDTSPEVYKVGLYVMDKLKNNQKLASATRKMGDDFKTSVLDSGTMEINPSDYMAAKCRFKSPNPRRPIHCAVHFLFEAESSEPISVFCNRSFLSHGDLNAASPHTESHAETKLPTDNPLLMLADAVSSSHFTAVDWMGAAGGRLKAAKEDHSMIGPLAGVAVDPASGRVVVVHTGDKTKRKSLFFSNNVYRYTEDGPISGNAVLELDPSTGIIEKAWGKNFFFLPHGVFVDHLGRTWITDRARHQVFGFRNYQKKPFLTLGEEFFPGTGDGQFCKPTGVAVSSSTSNIFVADGHCNSRIMKFSATGHLLANWALGKSKSAVFHSIALSPANDLVCIAVSTASQVFCVDQFSGSLMKTFQHADYPRPLDGIAFGNKWTNGHYVLHVGGGGLSSTQVKGVAVDFTSGDILDTYSPDVNANDLSVAHGLAASPDGMDIYMADLAPGTLLKFSRRVKSGNDSATMPTVNAFGATQGPKASTSHETHPKTTKPSMNKATAHESTPAVDSKTTHQSSGEVETHNAPSTHKMSTAGKKTHSTPGQSPSHKPTPGEDTATSKEAAGTSSDHQATSKTLPIQDTSNKSPPPSQQANREKILEILKNNPKQPPTAKPKPGKPGTESFFHDVTKPAQAEKKPHILTGAETIAISIIGSCIGIIIFAVIARLYLMLQKRRKFHRRLFPEKYESNSMSRKVLLQNGGSGYREGDDEESDTETEPVADQRAFRYYWKKVAKQVA